MSEPINCSTRAKTTNPKVGILGDDVEPEETGRTLKRGRQAKTSGWWS